MCGCSFSEGYGDAWHGLYYEWLFLDPAKWKAVIATIFNIFGGAQTLTSR